MQNQKKGSRASTCPLKNCLGCTVTLPNLNPYVIKNLGETFSKIDPASLTREAHHKKKKTFALSGQKLGKNKPKKWNVAQDNPKKKKPKN